MSCREPKLAALLADAQGRLSTAGQRRLAAHLARCEVCTDAHASGAVRALLGAINVGRTAQAPTLDWQRVERSMRSHGGMARAGSAAPWRPLAAACAAAAVLLGLSYAVLPSPQPAQPRAELSVRERVVLDAPPPSLQPPTQPVQAPERAALQDARWTLARMAALPDDTALVEGELLVTGAHETLHVQLEPGTGLVLEPGSTLRLQRLRAGDVQLELQAGAVTSRVRTLGPSERYEVRVGSERVRVLGTHFRVAREPHGTAVAIDEGVVEIVDGSDTVLAELRAPAAWPAAAAPASALTEPRAGAPSPVNWPLLRISGLERARAVEVGDTRVTVPGALAVRVPPGDVELRVEFAGGRTLATRVHAQGSVVEVDAARLKRVSPAAEPSTPYALPAPASGAVLAALMHRSTHALQRCYERSLLRHPDLEGRLHLHVKVGSDGRVTSTELTGAVAVPADLTACVGELTQRWQFPAHLAESELQAPLSFSRAAVHTEQRAAP